MHHFFFSRGCKKKVGARLRFGVKEKKEGAPRGGGGTRARLLRALEEMRRHHSVLNVESLYKGAGDG